MDGISKIKIPDEELDDLVQDLDDELFSLFLGSEDQEFFSLTELNCLKTRLRKKFHEYQSAVADSNQSKFRNGRPQERKELLDRYRRVYKQFKVKLATINDLGCAIVPPPVIEAATAVPQLTSSRMLTSIVPPPVIKAAAVVPQLASGKSPTSTTPAPVTEVAVVAPEAACSGPILATVPVMAHGTFANERAVSLYASSEASSCMILHDDAIDSPLNMWPPLGWPPPPNALVPNCFPPYRL